MIEKTKRPSVTDGKTKYLKRTRSKVLFTAVLAIALFISAVFVFYVDMKYTSFWYVLELTLNINDPNIPRSASILFTNVYVPRIIAGIVGGAALGVAGAVMQCVLRNPLGSPYTLGLSNAAAFGASIAIVVLNIGAFTVATMARTYFIALSAFLFSLAATWVIVCIVKVTRVDPPSMVLAGVAISSIFSAGMNFLQYIYSSEALEDMVFWQFGSLGKPDQTQLAIIAAVTVLAFIYFFKKRWDFNALDNGDEVATSLGVKVSSLRITELAVCSLMTALVVSFMGIIGFVGLIAPHMVRLLMGNDHRFLLPCSMLVGSLTLVLADCVGQNLFIAVVPVGIITSVLGGPMFLYLLIRSYRKNDRRRGRRVT